MIAVTEQPIDVGAWYGRIGQAGAGSVVVHVGVVKSNPKGGRSAGMTLGCDGDLEGELAGIERDVRQRWPVIDLVLVRRLGCLDVGDLLLFVGVAANDRGSAFDGCREVVERCKKLRCLRKEERFVCA